MVRKERASRRYGGALAETFCVGVSGFQPSRREWCFVLTIGLTKSTRTSEGCFVSKLICNPDDRTSGLLLKEATPP